MHPEEKKRWHRLMRLFIAISLSDAVKEALIDAQNIMYDCGVRGSYTKEENLHMTLAFIGENPDTDTIMEALSTVVATPFDLTLKGVGCFGDLWWAGIDESVPLSSVVRRIRRALAEGPIPFDKKKFTPHITLIRKARGKMPGIQIPPISMTVDSISLMRSDQSKSGMIYTEVERYKF
jgi:2'-5' RNA ligase